MVIEVSKSSPTSLLWGLAKPRIPGPHVKVAVEDPSQSMKVRLALPLTQTLGTSPLLRTYYVVLALLLER